MKFLIVGLKKGSQITRFQEEAQKLGHEVSGVLTKELFLERTEGNFKASAAGIPLSSYDLIYLCAGIESKIRFEWYVATQSLGSSVKVVNKVTLDREQRYYPVQAWFYLKGFEGGIPEPESYVVYTRENAFNAAERTGYPLILKISETHQGKGVYLVHDSKGIVDVTDAHPGKTFVIRKFIPNDGDLRVFVVGGKAIGAMKRTPKEGEFRSNISIGGSGSRFDLESDTMIKELAEKSAKITGVDIAGVDIIVDKETGKPYVLEINTGPQFKGLEKYTGVNAAGEIVKYFIEICNEKK